MANKRVDEFPVVFKVIDEDIIHLSKSSFDKKLSVGELFEGKTVTQTIGNNLGGEAGIYKEVADTTVDFRSLKTLTPSNLILTENADDITLDLTGVTIGGSAEGITTISPATGNIVLDCENGDKSTFVLFPTGDITDISVINTPTNPNSVFEISIIISMADTLHSVVFGSQFALVSGTDISNALNTRDYISAYTWDNGTTYYTAKTWSGVHVFLGTLDAFLALFTRLVDWRLEETTGTNLVDEAGNYNLTTVGSPTLNNSSGWIGAGVGIGTNGSTQWATASDVNVHTLFNITSGTVFFCGKTDILSGTQTMFSITKNTVDWWFSFSITSTGKVYGALRTNAPTNQWTFQTDNVVITAAQVFTAVITHDGIAPKLWIDGVNVPATFTLETLARGNWLSALDAGNVDRVSIGAFDRDTDSNFFDGEIYLAGAVNETWDAADVLDFHNAAEYDDVNGP